MSIKKIVEFNKQCTMIYSIKFQTYWECPGLKFFQIYKRSDWHTIRLRRVYTNKKNKIFLSRQILLKLFFFLWCSDVLLTTYLTSINKRLPTHFAIKNVCLLLAYCVLISNVLNPEKQKISNINSAYSISDFLSNAVR